MIIRQLHCKRLGMSMLLALLWFLIFASHVEAQAVQTGPIPVSLRPTKTLLVSNLLLSNEKIACIKVYAPCHGLDGRGQGKAAYSIYPWPPLQPVKPPAISEVVRYSGSGKTTLIERPIPALRKRGMRLATFKHTRHHGILIEKTICEIVVV